MNFLEKELEKSEKLLIKSVRVCPNCGSRDVTDRGMISRRAYSRNSVCRTCGFQSPLFPEVPLKEALKIPAQKRNFNTAYTPIFADKAVESKHSLIYRILAFIAIMALLYFLIVPR